MLKARQQSRRKLLSIKWPSGYDRLDLARVDSTLNEAARRFPTLAGPLWIFAREQSAARGRRGRIWLQPAGHFAATLALPAAGPPAQAALRSFVAALALHDALVEVSGSAAKFSLKWPNDVLLNGGKLAGILLESLQPDGLAIGIGVNLIAAPEAGAVEPGAARPVSLLGETGMRVGPHEFLLSLATAYAARETQFTSLGFAPIRQAWLARAARLGAQIKVRLPREEFHGKFEDVDEAGQLVLSTPEGLRKITAGEVFF